MKIKDFGILLAAAALPGAVVGEGQLTDEQTAFFESRIRPVLVESCYKCHSAEEKIKGGLSLDTRDGVRHGGDTGPAVVPGNLEESWLWTAINWADEDYEMPPKKKLPADVIDDFRQWIEMGAPDPRVAEKTVVGTEIDVERGRDFWSFRKPVAVEAPPVSDRGWPSSDVDRFILAGLDEAGLAPAEDAEPEVLLRRLYFDLVGLPPSPEEIEDYFKAYAKDPEEAYEGKIDELLARPQFGERWGRHWLDVARYAESTGKEINASFPHAWRYRDYVIDSFNEDKPYDRFVQEQIAGDLLPVDTDEEWQKNLVATAFLAIGPKGLNERDPRQFALDLADEQIDATTQAILGLTVSCARCHDHKSDPIPTADYYALSGIFQSTRTYYGTVNRIASRRGSKLLELPIPDEYPMRTFSSREISFMRERLFDAEQRLADLQAENFRRGPDAGAPENFQQVLRTRNTVTQLRAQLRGIDDSGNAKTLAMGVQDHERPVTPRVLVRGELDKPAQAVERGFPRVLHHAETPATLPDDASGRLELAMWMTSGENPLTSRVMVNRVWQAIFGRGIVASPNNFGATGQAPSHPGLLDHLAVRFMQDGWSVKALVRELVTTRTYRMGSTFDSGAFEKDPDNRLRWRHEPRSLDAEALRDAMLVAGGELDLGRPRGSIVARAGDAPVGLQLGADQLNRPVTYRSVYLPAARDALPESLALFDPADPNIVTGKREVSNVPGQALYLMNNTFVTRQADAMARRLIDEADSPGDRFSRAFAICFGRPPTSAEIDSSTSFFQRFLASAEEKGRSRDEAGLLAFQTFCQGLLSSAEFRFLN